MDQAQSSFYRILGEGVSLVLSCNKIQVFLFLTTKLPRKQIYESCCLPVETVPVLRKQVESQEEEIFSLATAHVHLLSGKCSLILQITISSSVMLRGRNRGSNKIFPFQVTWVILGYQLTSRNNLGCSVAAERKEMNGNMEIPKQ